MEKEFIPYDTVRDDAMRLAGRIYCDGFIPDVMYVLLRGGAYMGNCISEYYKARRGSCHPVHYAAVVARSYADVGNFDRVIVDGWTYSPKYLRDGDKVLLVDDIFDSGRTVNCIADVILNHGIERADLKIAVHDYKYFYDKPQQLPIQPDYWCRRFELSVNDNSRWIHYLAHELVGMSGEELEKYYYSHDASLRSVLGFLEDSGAEHGGA
jgi:hypoxanthine phosphoribosyltransferase